MTKRVDTSELKTTAGIVGHNDYVVNIQKYFNPPYTQMKLIYAVGVLIDLQHIVSSCSVFYDDVNKDITPEKQKYKLFRVVADGVTGHMDEVLDGIKVRFIDKVILHPKCTKIGRDEWKLDVAIVHTSFPFVLQPGIVGIMKFGHVPGGAEQLRKNRTRDFTEMYHQSVLHLGKNSPVCRVMSWGRYEKFALNGKTYTFQPSHRLLLYQVRLANTSDCMVFCDEDERFCQLTNTSVHPSVVCAYRGNSTYIFDGQDFSAYPCAGTEGSPLICHPPGRPEKEDIYGIVAYIPKTACVQQFLPVIITDIEELSKFVIEVVGKATTIEKPHFQLLMACILFAVRS